MLIGVDAHLSRRLKKTAPSEADSNVYILHMDSFNYYHEEKTIYEAMIRWDTSSRLFNTIHVVRNRWFYHLRGEEKLLTERETQDDKTRVDELKRYVHYISVDVSTLCSLALWSPSHTNGYIYLQVPQQPNSIDCGLYLLKNAKIIFSHISDLCAMTKTNLRTAYEWFNYKHDDICELRMSYLSLLIR